MKMLQKFRSKIKMESKRRSIHVDQRFHESINVATHLA
jgi:hypothetical protein